MSAGAVGPGQGAGAGQGTGSGRWEAWTRLYSRPSFFGNETGKLPNGYFQPSSDFLQKLQENAKVLVVGAGGLGCEILKVN